MDAITIQIVLAVAILGFMWKLHQEVSDLHKDNATLHKGMANLSQEFGRDIADLRERMARMEGLLEGFVGRPQELQS